MHGWGRLPRLLARTEVSGWAGGLICAAFDAGGRA